MRTCSGHSSLFLCNSLGLYQYDSDISNSFSQDIEILEFQLGDELANFYNRNNLSQNSVQSEDKIPAPYIIIQGRVRAQAAASLGFQTRPIRASLSRLAEQKHPWIAHWQGDHYIVVCQVNQKRVLVADPAIGKRSLSHHEFIAGWTGYVLLLDPTTQLATALTQKNSLGITALLWYGASLVIQERLTIAQYV